jgi:hypothetical protein
MTDKFEKFLLERVLHRIDHGERSPSWLGTLALAGAIGFGSYFLFSRSGTFGLGAIGAMCFIFGLFAGHGLSKAWQSLWWSVVVRYIDSTAIRARLAQLQA